MKQYFIIALCIICLIAGWFTKEHFTEPCPTTDTVEVSVVVDTNMIKAEMEARLRPVLTKEIRANFLSQINSKPSKIDTLIIYQDKEESSSGSFGASYGKNMAYIASIDTLIYSKDRKAKIKLGIKHISDIPFSEDTYFDIAVKAETTCLDTVKIKKEIIEVEVAPPFYKDHWFWSSVGAVAIAVAALIGGN